MKEQHLRTARLYGASAIEKLSAASVAVIGVGGVGSYTVEALSRAGIGHMVLIDADTVSVTNINRQLIATHSTVGRDKVEVARERLYDIDPDIKVDTVKVYVTPENVDTLPLDVDYIVDAIDNVKAKLALIRYAKERGIRIISAMGTGNKTEPSKLCVSDISKTAVCPLARAVRTGLKKMGIYKLKVVYSTELPMKKETGEEEEFREDAHAPASNSFVPATAGLLIASEVIRDILSQ